VLLGKVEERISNGDARLQELEIDRRRGEGYSGRRAAWEEETEQERGRAWATLDEVYRDVVAGATTAGAGELVDAFSTALLRRSPQHRQPQRSPRFFPGACTFDQYVATSLDAERAKLKVLRAVQGRIR